MESDLQQALHILHAILKKTVTLKYLLKQPKQSDLKGFSTLDQKQLLTPEVRDQIKEF